jgi:ribonucleoside-diphosphate reductase beta chain
MKGCTVILHLHNHHLVNKVPKDRIREIIVDALKIEIYHQVVTSIFSGMNAGLMTQYLGL